MNKIFLKKVLSTLYFSILVFSYSPILAEIDETVAEGRGLHTAKECDFQQKSYSYYSTHTGAYHNPVYISFLGDLVSLEDGTEWGVATEDRGITRSWMPGDTVVITANTNLATCYYYYYKLINLNTGSYVKVNMTLGPIVNGLYTYWIKSIDYYNRQVYLNDGSVWNVGANINNWLLTDVVLLGINDSWYSGSYPNILINLTTGTCAISNCIY